MSNSLKSSWRTGIKNPLVWMVLFALASRVALVLGFHYYDFTNANSSFAQFQFTPDAIKHFPFGFGYETGAVAYSLATGHGFASPFAGSTGPTAWLAPLYPAMCALVFKIFGCFTVVSAIVILTINSLFAALTCIPICRIAERMGARKAGLWAGWVWAGGAFFMYWPTTWIWEVSLSALLVSVLFLESLRLATNASFKSWARFGLIWGIAALTNPALLAFLPAAGLYPAYGLWRSRQEWHRPVTAAALVFALCMAPWLIRNRAVFGRWIFIRGNAPFEFSLGNYHNSNGMGWYGKHPSQNKFEWAKYERLGEVAYVAEKKQLALAFVKEYPGEFLGLCAVRIAAFWTGSPLTTDEWFRQWFYRPLAALMLLGLIASLAYGVEGAWLFFGLMLSYPLTYYVVFAQPRYRHAIEPEMLLLSTYFVYMAIRDIGARFSARKGSQSVAGFDGELEGQLSVR